MAGKRHFAPDRARPDPVRCSGLSAGASLQRGFPGSRCAAVAAGTEQPIDAVVRDLMIGYFHPFTPTDARISAARKPP